MHITHEFETAVKNEKQKAFRTALKTAEKLNNRISNFLNDVSKNGYINKNNEKIIIDTLFKNIENATK